ncbi:MAG: recombination regulator RecX [Legionella sp.]|nr:MAG: recombination regulator RecX [Legionella sp.]
MTRAFESAMRLLVGREHGASELCTKLERKGFSPREARDAVEACQRLGLQCDNRFVEQFSRSRISQGYGPLKIMQELKNRGIDSEPIQSYLAQERDKWFDHALSVWEKKSKGQKQLSFDELQKMQRFLLYRGFSMDIITKVMKSANSA